MSRRAHANTRYTFEVIHVRRGTLTLVVGKRRVEIAVGGSVVARMDQRHQYQNEGRTPVVMSMVVVDPTDVASRLSRTSRHKTRDQ